MKDNITRKDGSYEGYVLSDYERLGDYEGIKIYDNEILKLELRVSGSAIAARNCGLNDINLHDWLFKEAIKLAEILKSEGVNQFKTLVITSSDVEHGELNTNWKNIQLDTKS